MASLASSIQCTSSITYTRRRGPGQGGGVQQRGQPAPPRIGGDGGQRDCGVTDPEQIVQQQQVLWVRRRGCGSRTCARAASLVESLTPNTVRSRRATTMERDLAGMGFAVGGEHLDAAAGSQSSRASPHDPALADTGRPDHPDHTSVRRLIA